MKSPLRNICVLAAGIATTAAIAAPCWHHRPPIACPCGRPSRARLFMTLIAGWKIGTIPRCRRGAMRRTRARGPISTRYRRRTRSKELTADHGDIALLFRADGARQTCLRDLQRSRQAAAHAGDAERQRRSPSRKSVLDPNQLDAKGLTAIDWFVPSPDGKPSRCRCRRTAARTARCTSTTWRAARRSRRRSARAISHSRRQPRLGARRQGLLVHALSRRRSAGGRPAFQYAGLFPRLGDDCEDRCAGAGCQGRAGARVGGVSRQSL